MTLKHAWMVLVFVLSSSAAFADPVVITPSSLNLGFVTCIQNTSSSGGCLGDPSATSAWWRIVNGAYVDLHDVTLTFQFAGGSLDEHWDVIQHETYVETSHFSISSVFALTSLSLQGTLPQTTFDPIFYGCCLEGRSYSSAFIAASDVFSNTSTSFPPPLNIVAPGTRIDTPSPIPEPASLTLLTTGFMGLIGIKRRRRLR